MRPGALAGGGGGGHAGGGGGQAVDHCRAGQGRGTRSSSGVGWEGWVGSEEAGQEQAGRSWDVTQVKSPLAGSGTGLRPPPSLPPCLPTVMPPTIGGGGGGHVRAAGVTVRAGRGGRQAAAGAGGGAHDGLHVLRRDDRWREGEIAWALERGSSRGEHTLLMWRPAPRHASQPRPQLSPRLTTNPPAPRPTHAAAAQHPHTPHPSPPAHLCVGGGVGGGRGARAALAAQRGQQDIGVCWDVQVAEPHLADDLAPGEGVA